MDDYGKVDKIRRLARQLGIKFECANLNARVDGDVEFVYANGVSRYYRYAEVGFDREVERLEHFVHAAETI